MMPFVRLNCGVFDMYPCCDSWLVDSGAGLSASVNEKATYWISDKMNKFRSSIADGSYKYCKQSCPFLMDRDNSCNQLLKTEAQIEAEYPPELSTAILDYIRSNRYDKKFTEMPYELGLSYDPSCNLSCRSCRHKVMGFTSSFTTIQENRVCGYFDSTQVVYITGDGDPFASDYYRSLLHDDIRLRFPNAKSIIIQTNALLLDNVMWDLIHPYNKSIIKQITVSIDACTKSTYEYIRRGGDFNRLLDNLQFIYRIRESGQIDSLVTSFTISAYNVHEAVEFCEFARRLGFDKVEYWVVQDWRRGDTYTAMAAHVPNSQHYSTFCDVIERIRELKNNSLGIDVLCGY